MPPHTQRPGFTFKQFHVAHDCCAMKVGTDGILLGAWAPAEPERRVLDIGTRSGLLGLMLAQRTRGQLHIDGLDIDPAAVKQAQENAAHSPWPHCMQTHPCALQTYEAPPYDLLISNPPYFPHGPVSNVQARSWARHTQALSHIELLKHAARLSHAGSQLALILPAEASMLLVSQSPAFNWHLSHRCNVLPFPGKPPVRQLLLFCRAPTISVEESAITVRQAPGVYHPSYIAHGRPFYLKM